VVQRRRNRGQEAIDRGSDRGLIGTRGLQDYDYNNSPIWDIPADHRSYAQSRSHELGPRTTVLLSEKFATGIFRPGATSHEPRRSPRRRRTRSGTLMIWALRHLTYLTQFELYTHSSPMEIADDPTRPTTPHPRQPEPVSHSSEGLDAPHLRDIGALFAQMTDRPCQLTSSETFFLLQSCCPIPFVFQCSLVVFRA
jgi:hypothetical protein